MANFWNALDNLRTRYYSTQEPKTNLTRAPSGEFEQLQAKYKDLFHCEFIQHSDHTFSVSHDIHTGNSMCVATQKVSNLGVGMLKKSLALGGIGTTEKGETFITLAHFRYDNVKFMFETLKKDLINNDCEESSIKFYAVGGVLQGVHGDDGDSFNIQKEVIKFGKNYNLKGVKFNACTSEDSLQVVLNQFGMYWSKKQLFQHSSETDSAQEWI